MLVSFIALMLAGNSPPKVVKIVKVEGASFKVRQRGNEATVARQAALVNANAHHFRLAKRAAEIASGCTAVDAFPVLALLNVTLDCSKPPTPAPSDVQIKENE